MDVQFVWEQCVNKLSPVQCEAIAIERSVQVLTIEHLREHRWIGWCRVQKWQCSCIAFPIQDEGGDVYRAHCRAPQRDNAGKWQWAYEPAADPLGRLVTALVLGNLQTAKRVYLFESQWCAIGLIDKLDLLSEIDSGEVCLIATRGARIGNRLEDLCFPTWIDAYAFAQNDEPGQKWLSDVSAALGGVFDAKVPKTFKDLGEWIKAGGAKAYEIEGALDNAEFLKPPAAQSANGQFPPVIDANTIDPTQIILPPPIIAGLFSLTEKLELAGGSKSFKTWSLIDMGLSVANGAPWWNQQTFLRHVVYLNMELSQPYFEHRLVEVARVRGLSLATTFHVIHLRGAKLHDRQRWEAFLKYLESLLHRFPNPLLISDPIYKMLGGKSENSAGDINIMMDQLEDLIQRTQGANAFGHHFTKGNQADKEAIDRASGSGVFQRDPDALLTMTKHENDDCYSVGAILRNHQPIPDFVLEWHYPIFVARTDLDPENLKKPSTRGPKFTIDQLVQILGNRFLKTGQFKKRAMDELGMSKTIFFELLKKAAAQNLISKNLVSEEWEIIQRNS